MYKIYYKHVYNFLIDKNGSFYLLYTLLHFMKWNYMKNIKYIYKNIYIVLL